MKTRTTTLKRATPTTASWTSRTSQSAQRETLERPSAPAPEPLTRVNLARVPAHHRAPLSGFVVTPARRGIQCKLRVTPASDPLEQEADRIADLVIGTPGPRIPVGGLLVARAPAEVQRACVACKDEEPLENPRTKRESDDDPILGKLTGTPAPIGRALEHRIRSLPGGEPLPVAERRFFEPRFGHDFSRVRVHAGAQAGGAARELGARAFTLGRDIIFSPGQYSPGTHSGRHLLAHELTHIVQQGAGAPAVIQRELATPEPATPAGKQDDLTKAQIATALAFNKLHFNAASTKKIQDIIGTTPTGTWVEDDISAIASIQESHGLKKDGIVGAATFQFLDQELTNEKVDKTDENCLVSFAVIGSPVKVSPLVAGLVSISANFKMSALLPEHCGCADFEYRQFIKGHWHHVRGGVTTDQKNRFANFPGGGGLPTAWAEDGNTAATAVNYGHRNQTAETINHYLNAAGKVDQAKGCRYEGSDTPGGPNPAASGDVYDIQLDFRGEIQRKKKVVASQQWTPIKGKFAIP